jgi:hypothetical protein
MKKILAIVTVLLTTAPSWSAVSNGKFRMNVLTSIGVATAVIEGAPAKALYDFLTVTPTAVEPGVLYKEGVNISCVQLRMTAAKTGYQCSFIATDSGILEPNAPTEGVGGFSISN